jgi:sugar phosphate isomerase/epimerase
MTSPSTPVPLSFAHLAALAVEPPRLIEMLARAGFSSTGIRMRRTIAGTPEHPLDDPAQLRATRAAIAATGVSVLYIEIVFLDRHLNVGELHRMFERGAELAATRVVAAGTDSDFGVVAEKLADVCDLARGYGLAVDVEFMPYQPVRTLADALDVVGRSGKPNAHVLLDALHFYRSHSRLEDLKGLDPRLLGAFQLCDAPRDAPADLAFEARNARLLPGEGGLDLHALMDVLPPGLPLGLEVPLALAHPELDDFARARLTVEATRRFLTHPRRQEHYPGNVP